MRRSLMLALGAALVAAPVLTSGQTAAFGQSAEAYKAPRTSFGQPDIMGYWTNNTLTPLTRRANVRDRLAYTEEEVKKLEGDVLIEVEEGNAPTDPDAPADFRQESTVVRPEFQAAGGEVGGYNRFWLDPGNRVMRVNGEPRTSLLTTANGQFPQRKPDATPPPRSPRPAGGPLGSFDSYETRSLGERCVIGFGRNGGPPMFPNGFYNNNYHIVQSPDAVMIEVEMNHDARIIRLNAQHRPGDVRPYFGDSIGRWEGETLVIETINLPESQQIAGSWKDLKVTERLTRVGENRLHYAFTIEDPTLWAEPFGGEYEFSPLDGQIYEYACHEGNYALPGILIGARVEEGAKPTGSSH
ncbi:hypothetical protein GC169_12165 [bacterium]|nr:hypothetical protein [bacterium]